VKVAVLGGGVALLASRELRSRLLDALFGAEEEFDYSSLTEPAEPASRGDEHSPTAPWVRPPSEPDSSAVAEPEPDDTSPEPDSEPQAASDGIGPGDDSAGESASPPRLSSSIAPSPAAWRAAAAEQATDKSTVQDSPVATARAHENGSSPTLAPPAPPPGWWSPSKPGIDPVG
jgi:hypothetical protein